MNKMGFSFVVENSIMTVYLSSHVCDTDGSFRKIYSEELLRHKESIKRVTLELSGVTHIDSSGIGTLLFAKRFAESEIPKIKVVVRSPSAVARETLETTRLASNFLDIE